MDLDQKSKTGSAPTLPDDASENQKRVIHHLHFKNMTNLCEVKGRQLLFNIFDLKMKLTGLFVLFSLFTIMANTGYSQAITIDLEDTTIDRVIDRIEVTSSYSFIYNTRFVDLKRKVSLSVHEAPIERILSLLFEETKTSFEVMGNEIYLRSKESVEELEADPEVKEDPQTSISGTVRDADGQPLPGANVLEKGTSNGTQSDFDGNFTLEISTENPILIVSFLGFSTKEVSLKDQSTIEVTLLEDAGLLDEVVIVGYGTQKKASLTGSVATVKSDEITAVPTSNINSTLAGRMPGVIVTQGSGRPGADAASISIRGFGSNNVESGEGVVQNESPLVIVDGIQRPFSQIDPNEIESITVLKDAEAAVYGIQAAAGVILVTTKRGNLGKPIISLNSTYSFTQNTKFPRYANFLEQYNALEYADPGKQEEILSNIEGRVTPERLAGLQDGSIPGTDWFDVMTRDYTPMQQHNLNIRGGTENIKYFGSVGYLNQGAIWASKDFDYERFNTTLNMDVKVTERLKLSLDFSWRKEFNERYSGSDTDSNDLNQLTISEPGFPSSLPNGAIPVSNATIGNFNPIAITTKSITGSKMNTIDVLLGAMEIDYRIPGIEGLHVFDKFAVNNTFDLEKNVIKPFTPYYYDGTTYTAIEPNFSAARLFETHRTYQRITNQLGLRYGNSLGKHNIGGLLLLETLQDHNTMISASRENLLSGDVPYLFAGDPATQQNNGLETEFARRGVVGSITYDYDNKYLLKLSGRYDGSPYFPKETRYGFFPGVSAGWVISNEPFYNTDALVNRVKIRTSFAQLGNDNANSFDYLEGYQITNENDTYVIDGRQITGLRTLGIPNPYITWQRSNTYNSGIELGLLRNKLIFEADVFYRKRYDLLRQDNITIPTTVGADVPLANLESRSNRGVEFLISYQENFNDLRLSTSANFSWAREKYLNYVESNTFENEDQERIQRRSNQWVNRTFGYIFDGFFNSQEEIDNATIDYGGGAGNGNLRPGDIKVRDLNGDGVINSNDQTAIGRGYTPEITYGWNTTLSWKNFDLTMLWQGAANFNQNMEGYARSVDDRVPFKYVTEHVWTPERGDNALFPARSRAGLNAATIDKYFVDASYIRLRNLVLGYNLPKTWINRTGIDSWRVTLSGTNLWTIDGFGIYPYDPESGGPTNYPAQSVFTVGLNISL